MRIIEALLDRLAYEPGSMWRAEELLGGREWFGYSLPVQHLAAIVDSITLNSKVSGGVKRPRLKPSDRMTSPEIRKPRNVVSTSNNLGSLFAGM